MIAISTFSCKEMDGDNLRLPECSCYNLDSHLM